MMKKLRSVLPLLAFLFAAVAALAFRSTADDEILKRKVSTNSPCEIQSECTLMTPGFACSFQVYDEGCDPVTRYKLTP